jgi:hypothetical protein
MPDDGNNNGGGAQGANPNGDGQNPGGSPSGGAGGGNSHGGGAGGGTGSPSGDHSDQLSQLRNEAAQRRRENTQLNEQLRAAQTQLSELGQKFSTLETRDRDRNIRDAASVAVKAINSPHTDAILRLVDTSKITVNADGSVDPTSVKAELDRLKTETPTLFAPSGSHSSDAGAGGGGGGVMASAMNNLIRRAAGRS